MLAVVHCSVGCLFPIHRTYLQLLSQLFIAVRSSFIAVRLYLHEAKVVLDAAGMTPPDLAAIAGVAMTDHAKALWTVWKEWATCKKAF
jgi:hypothetical protein